MALSAHDAFSAAGRRRRRGGSRRSALSEINVTPLVDVMLVLLIVFMIFQKQIIESIAISGVKG